MSETDWSDPGAVPDTSRKSFEHALFAAFKAGVELGAQPSYEEPRAIPIDYRNLRWRAFRDAWAGEPWTQERWEDESRRLWDNREGRALV